MAKHTKGKSLFGKNKKKVDRKKQNNQQFFITLSEEFTSIYMNNGFDQDSEAVIAAFERYNNRWKDYARKFITNNIKLYPNKVKRQDFISTFERFVDKLTKHSVNSDGTLEAKEKPELIETKQVIKPKTKAAQFLNGGIENIPPAVVEIGHEDGQYICTLECTSCGGHFDMDKMEEDDGGNWFCTPCYTELLPDMIKDQQEANDDDYNERDVNDWYDCPIEQIKDALEFMGIKTRARTIKGLTPVVNGLDGDQLSVLIRRLGI